MRRFAGLLLIGTLVALVTLAAQSGSNARAARPYTTWRAYGGGAHSSQYSALNQINKSNVAQLVVAWTHQVNGNIIFNPIVVDGVMYLQGTGSAIVALDAATGKEIWRHANQGAIGARGFNYWESSDRKDRRILYLNAGHLTAINAENGETLTSFGDNGRVDLRIALYRQAAKPYTTWTAYQGGAHSSSTPPSTRSTSPTCPCSRWPGPTRSTGPSRSTR